MANKTKLSQFRHDVARLKKAGVISPKINARTIAPGLKGGSVLKKKIREFEAILSGKAKAVKITEAETRKTYKAMGKPVVRGRVIFEKEPEEKARVSHGKVKFVGPNLERRLIPVEFHNLDQYFDDIRRNADNIDSKLGKGERFAFKFFGHKSYKLYSDIEHLVDDISKYSGIDNAKTDRQQLEVFESLEIIKFTKGKRWRAPNEVSPSNRPRNYSNVKSRFDRAPAYKQEQVRKQRAESARKWRENLKRNPAKYQAYLKKNRERVRKNRG